MVASLHYRMMGSMIWMVHVDERGVEQLPWHFLRYGERDTRVNAD